MATKPADAKPGKKDAGARPRGKDRPAPDTGAEPAALRLKDLVEQIAAGADGVKKKDVKAVVEATLAALGTALSAGRDLHLPPLGKARVGRQKGQAGSGDELLVIRLKRGGASKAAVTKDANSGEKDVPEGVAAAEE